MNKQQHITILKRQVKLGEELMQVAKQNFKAAARSVSEARSALVELGASNGPARKGKRITLTEEEKMSLKSSMTKR